MRVKNLMTKQANLNLTNQNISVIGYGNFGEFFCREVLPKKNLTIYTPNPENKKFPEKATIAKSIKEAVENADIIIPTVSMREFANVIKNISLYIKPNAIIMDVCTVKTYPVVVMKKNLPGTVQIIATHPMFGPTTFLKKKSLKGFLFITKNISAKKQKYLEIMDYFKNLGMHIMEMEPDEHDKLAANSQFFTQLVRFIANQQNLKPTKIDTPSSSLLFEALDYLGKDEKLFFDILTYNPYCLELLKSINASLTDLNKNAQIKIRENQL